MAMREDRLRRGKPGSRVVVGVQRILLRPLGSRLQQNRRHLTKRYSSDVGVLLAV